MMRIPFTKMHGLGNDFVVLDCMDGSATAYDLPDMSRKLCDRHFGIGADGILVIVPHPVADCRMRIFNSDGSEAEMCGNGIRCVGKYIFDNQITSSLTPLIATSAGIKKLTMSIGRDGLVDSVSVDMGQPYIDADIVEKPVVTATHILYNVTSVNVGNPHGVVFVEKLNNTPVEADGAELECNSMWPGKANIEFVEVVSKSVLRQRTWERGVGVTLACGTGACAVAVAAVATGRAEWPVEVILDGGNLLIHCTSDGHIVMTGKATTVFKTIMEL